MQGMAVTVELTIPSDEFDLGRVTKGDNDVHLELERLVPTGTEVMPFFWATGTEFDAFERNVRENELVENLVAVTRIDDKVLYHVTWGETVSSLTEILEKSNATILEAHGNDPWLFRLRFADHRGVRDFYNLCLEADMGIHVERLYSLDEEQDTVQSFRLTDEQQVALVTAVENGYFGVPRGTTLEKIAEELGISPQAASERVRRGADTVLRSVLLDRSARDFA